MTEQDIQDIVRSIGNSFRVFGGGKVRDENNPIAYAFRDKPLMFAAGVPVEDVVRFVVMITESIKQADVAK